MCLATLTHTHTYIKYTAAYYKVRAMIEASALAIIKPNVWSIVVDAVPVLLILNRHMHTHTQTHTLNCRIFGYRLLKINQKSNKFSKRRRRRR